uniref:Uncharacterized protein n=1 Tax=Rhizophora mucronata TaxID=61149 RepID=A0A2P2Q4S9_RHIMU
MMPLRLSNAINITMRLMNQTIKPFTGRDLQLSTLMIFLFIAGQ